MLKLSPLSLSCVLQVLRDLHLLKQTGQWHQKQTRIDFWKKCHDSFTKNSISNKAASDFFSAQANVVFESSADKINSNIEKHLLLTLAGHWLAQDDSVPLEKLEEMEKQIWLCRIAHQTLTRDSGLEKSRLSCQVSMGSELSFENLAKEFSFSKLATLNTPKYLQLDGLVFKDTPPHALDRTEVESLTFLIGHLLDEGSVHEASRVCHYFHFYNQDVSLVLHCRALAAGEADQNNLHPDIQALLVAEESSDEFEAPQPRRLQSSK